MGVEFFGFLNLARELAAREPSLAKVNVAPCFYRQPHLASSGKAVHYLWIGDERCHLQIAITVALQLTTN
jgi:hypothetical protein